MVNDGNIIAHFYGERFGLLIMKNYKMLDILSQHELS